MCVCVQCCGKLTKGKWLFKLKLSKQWMCAQQSSAKPTFLSQKLNAIEWQISLIKCFSVYPKSDSPMNHFPWMKERKRQTSMHGCSEICMKISSLWKRRQLSTELMFLGVLCTDVSGGKCRGFHEMPKTLHRISCNLVNGIALMRGSLPALFSLPPLVGDMSAGVHKTSLRSCVPCGDGVC